MNTTIIWVAQYFIYLSVAITAIYWLTLRHKSKLSFAWRGAISALLALVLAKLAGAIFYDPRPFVAMHTQPLIPHAADNGFPSDHALLAAFLGFFVLAYSRKVGAVLLIIAAIIGTARVAAHVHNPVDVIASFIIAASAVASVDFATKLFKRYNT